MSKEIINLDLPLAPPNSSHLQSPPAVQESPDESLQESLDGRHLQLPSPAVQEPIEYTYIEVPYRGPQIPFYNCFGPKNGDNNTRIQEPPSTHPPLQSLQESRQESLQESLDGRQLQLPSPVVQEPIEFTLIEVPHRQSQVLPFYNFFGPKNGDNTKIQEPPSPLQREIRALYPWAKSTGFEVHTLKYLVSKNITKISGEIMCKKCKKMEILEYNLKEKFGEVYCKCIKENVKQLRHRDLGRCSMCRSYSLKPVISEKEEEINWLFLMLGQMLGWCSKDQLWFFCDKNGERRYDVKDRLVYIANGIICNQLDPTLTFEF